jgi:hypothetical protein
MDIERSVSEMGPTADLGHDLGMTAFTRKPAIPTSGEKRT